MNIAFIRHGATAGNLDARYVGTTDEPLSEIGRAQLLERTYPSVQRVYASPMLRATQTAGLIYPDVPVTILCDFRECDFGTFEYKNYRELADHADYQAWLDSAGTRPFPGGETRAGFTARCVRAFDALVLSLQEDAAIVAHGGTLMAILSERSSPARGYYDFQVKNGGGYLTQWDGKTLRILQPL